MTHSTQQRARLVYSAAQFAIVELQSAELVKRPTSEVHGKEPGTTLTLCGEVASTWHKFWDQPFEHVTVPRCPRCVTELTRRRRVT